MRQSPTHRRAVLAASMTGLLSAALIVQSFASAATPRPRLIGFGSSIRDAQSLPLAAHAAARGKKHASFSISGAVTGLFPGAVVPLALTVMNPNRFTITVKSITTTVGDASSACVSSNVNVSNFSGSLRVEPRSSRTLNVRVTVTLATPNACQGAVFPFSYLGWAKKG